MRSILLSIALVIGLAAAADAEGLFVEEGIGGADYRGDLVAFDGSPRFQLSLGLRRGPWTLALLGGATEPDLFSVDCHGSECDVKPRASYSFGGADLKRAWPLAAKNEHFAVRLFMHGGVRWFDGDDDIEGYAGPGVGGGAGLEGDCYVIGYALDFGLDAMWLHAPAEPPPMLAKAPSGLGSTGDIFAAAPYVMVTGRIGWM